MVKQVKPVKQVTLRKRRKPAPPPKHWWESRVVLFNGAVMVLSVISTGLPALQDSLPPQTYELAMAVITLINVCLRFKTNRPIKRMGQGGGDE